MSTEAPCNLPSSVDTDHGHETSNTLSSSSDSNTVGSTGTTTDDLTVHNSNPHQFGVTTFFTPGQATLRIRPSAHAAASSPSSLSSSSATASTSVMAAEKTAGASSFSPSSLSTATGAGATLLDKGASTANRLHATFGSQLDRSFSHDHDPDHLGDCRESDAHTRIRIQTTPPPSSLEPSLSRGAGTLPRRSSSSILGSSNDTSEDLDQSTLADASSARADPKSSSVAEGATASEDTGAEFSCNICFDIAISPVLTLCGHLFCWSCLHQWLEAQRQNPLCPVCKAGCGQDKVIPIYGRGREQVDPRTTTPKRPAGQRPEPTRTAPGGFSFGGGQVTFSGTMIPPFMFSPLGIHFGSSHATAIHINTGGKWMTKRELLYAFYSGYQRWRHVGGGRYGLMVLILILCLICIYCDCSCSIAQTPANAYVSRMLLMLGVMMLVAILLY